jgi:hypothetical protein
MIDSLSQGISNSLPKSHSKDHVINLLNLGAKITFASTKTTIMFNGLEYYSLEMQLNENNFYIQAFESEAEELYNLVMALNHEKCQFYSDKQHEGV